MRTGPGQAATSAPKPSCGLLPDGYTLLLVISGYVAAAALYPNLSFNFVNDIAPVALIGIAPYVVSVTPSFPAKTLSEFIAYAKANPGKINMASSGSGTAPHLVGELFKMMAGVDIAHVPYRGNYMPTCSPDRYKLPSYR